MKDKVVRINLNLTEQAKELYDDEKRGITRSLEAYFKLLQYAKAGLKGVFTREEWTGMIQSFNGTLTEPSYMCSKSMLKANLEDCERLEFMSSLYSFDYDELIEKIDKLGDAEVYFLQDLIYRFWNVGENDLEGFLKEMAKD